jgi:hypothetical protein
MVEMLYIDETGLSIYEGLSDEYDISMQFLDIPIITVQCLLPFSPYIQSCPIVPVVFIVSQAIWFSKSRHIYKLDKELVKMQAQ